ncbi:MAG: MFS transporter [Rhodospirillales bacterium]|jgi:MFS transporter, OFA family, oxalate/formate antiporter|nr:MFS transporter [Rhodospirillales bacterium]MBT4039213.1 MFS transporter [Rhodospirillales bacterium]MBT4625866.1 MFS transporter [Rhodospirillales bacterium]MBT5350534.1 MFS transporter [Rhodospirillales bacterium]MBT5522199.1 MFS transporter [Rhodospirillales bacterium]
MALLPSKISLNSGILVLAGSMLLMLVLGSVHAFSIFLTSIESEFNASRSNASLTYSLALAVLTIHVLISDRIFRHLSPGLLIVIVTSLATTGALMAGYGGNLYTIWLGYGVLFGAANGLGYSFVLQFSAQANPRFSGTAMGLVTAAYGFGAAISPLPFETLVQSFGFRGGMIGLAVALVIVGPVVGVLFARSGFSLSTDSGTDLDQARPVRGVIIRLWFSYGTAVAAGLMAIGHATGIANSSGLSREWLFMAPTLIAVGNIGGSYFGGYIVDKWGARRLLRLVNCFSAMSLTLMWIFLSPATALVGLAIVGFTYGATIAAFPVAIAKLFGAVAGIRVYGKVFTAWGTAGLFAPWIAGLLYERSGDYSTALLLAAILAVLSAISIFWFPRQQRA